MGACFAYPYFHIDQFLGKVELEFLPPHIPTVEEKSDPMLFAANVRKEMASALGIQLCDLRLSQNIKSY